MPGKLSRRTILTGASAIAFSSNRVRAGRRLIRIANNQVANTPYGAACGALSDAIAHDPILAPLCQPVVYEYAELGEEVASVKSAIKGTVDIVCSASGALSTYLPEIGLLDAPFLFRDANAARAILDGEIGDELIHKLQVKGIHVLGWTENGMRQMTANKPIRRPADLAGLKLRVPVTEIMIAAFKALGAEPRGLPFPLVYEALRTGDFDAQENPVANIEYGRLAEVQKYLSLTRHTYSAAVLLVSQDLLDDLTPAQNIALLTCAQKAKAASRAFAETAERDGLAHLRAQGMTIVDDVDTAAMVAAAKPNLVTIGEKFGPELMARLLRAGA